MRSVLRAPGSQPTGGVGGGCWPGQRGAAATRPLLLRALLLRAGGCCCGRLLVGGDELGAVAGPIEVNRPASRSVTRSDGGRLLARHERCWADHQSITDPQHQQAAAAMRAELSRQHRAPQPDRRPGAHEVQQRPLTDYDAVFGLDAVDAAAMA